MGTLPRLSKCWKPFTWFGLWLLLSWNLTVAIWVFSHCVIFPLILLPFLIWKDPCLHKLWLSDQNNLLMSRIHNQQDNVIYNLNFLFPCMCRNKKVDLAERLLFSQWWHETFIQNKLTRTSQHMTTHPSRKPPHTALLSRWPHALLIHIARSQRTRRSRHSCHLCLNSHCSH